MPLAQLERCFRASSGVALDSASTSRRQAENDVDLVEQRQLQADAGHCDISAGKETTIRRRRRPSPD